MTLQVMLVLAIIIGMSVLFVTEALPLAFTAFLVPVMLQGCGILDHTQAWAGFSNYMIIAQISLFIIGAVFSKSSFTYYIRKWICRMISAGSKVWAFLFVLIIMLFLSIAVTATSAIAVMAPILVEICDLFGLEEKKAFKTIGDASQWTSTLTLPVGAAFSYFLLCNSYLELAGSDVRFNMFDFLLIKGPTVCMIIIWVLFENRKSLSGKITEGFLKNDEEMLSKTEYTSCQDFLAQSIFFGNLILMIVSSVFKTTSIQPYIVSAFFAVLCVALRLISDREAFSSISWNVIFLIAGTLPLATAIKISGTDTWIAELFQKWLPVLQSPFILSTVFCLITCILTQFASNTAVIAIFVPLGVSITSVYGMDPRLIISAVFCGASMAFSTPMATTSAAYIYERCNFSMKEFISIGWRPCALMFISYILWTPTAFRILYG